MDISANLRNALRNRRIRQATVAKALGVSRTSVHSWMIGQTTPSLENLVKLSGLLHMSVDDILKGNEAEQKTTISINEPLNYDIIVAGGIQHYYLETENHPTLKEILKKCYGSEWNRSVHYVICQDILDGIVICANNHRKGVAEIIGSTEGYA